MLSMTSQIECFFLGMFIPYGATIFSLINDVNSEFVKGFFRYFKST